MAEFKEIMKEKNRMCENTHCDECNLYSENNKAGESCPNFIVLYPDEAEKIIMDWAKEHPIQTNADKFKEVFGVDDALTFHNCALFKCPVARSCDKCKYKDFWEKEYIEPKGI